MPSITREIAKRREGTQCMWYLRGTGPRCRQIAVWTYGSVFCDKSPVYCHTHGQKLHDRWVKQRKLDMRRGKHASTAHALKEPHGEPVHLDQGDHGGG